MLRSFFKTKFTNDFRWLKSLLIGTLCISLGAILFERLFVLLGVPTPYELFALTNQAIEDGFIWQFLTYPLLSPSYFGMSIGFLFSLLFYCYLLWAIGASLCRQKGEKGFLALYASSSLFVGLILTIVHFYYGTALNYCGNKAFTYTLLLSWTALNPQARLYLFFIAPIKASTLILISLCFNLFIDLANLEFTEVAAYLAATVYTYLHLLFIWKVNSPFPLLHKAENKLLEYMAQLKSKKRAGYSSKIYDIKTGKTIVHDKAFFHAALAKIALKGKKSLSWKERWRLYRVSKKFNAGRDF